MSSRKYYCELCDKRFADNPQSRRNHLKGVQHQRMRKQHYDTFRDPAQILAEEQMKKPCRTFQQTGDCHFGANCRFSHLTPYELHNLEAQDREKLNRENSVVSLKENRMRKSEDGPNLESWLEKRKKKSTNIDTQEPVEETERAGTEYMLPPSLMGLSNIPISLLPAPRGTECNLPIEEWG